MSIRLSGVFAVAIAYMFAVSVALGASALGAHAARIAGIGPEICQQNGGGQDGGALCADLCQIAGAPMLGHHTAPSLSALGLAPFATASESEASALSVETINASARGPPHRA